MQRPPPSLPLRHAPRLPSLWPQIRLQAVAELQRVSSQLSPEQEVLAAPHLAALLGFLMGLLDDSNFKISLTSLHIISDLLDRFAEQAKTLASRPITSSRP